MRTLALSLAILFTAIGSAFMLGVAQPTYAAGTLPDVTIDDTGCELTDADREKGVRCLKDDMNPGGPFQGRIGADFGMTKIASYLLGLVGGLALLFIIIGGFTYMTSGDDLEKLAKAKRTILYAIVGLVLSLLSYVMVSQLLTTAFTAGT